METLKTSAISQGVSEDEWKQMLAYSAAVFQNCGNYHSFGDTKFVPQLNADQFKKVYKASESYQVYSEKMDFLMEKIEKEVYTEEDPFARIGFRDENNGTTSYYSSNVTKDDAKMIDDWCVEINVSPLNTRLFKTGDNEYELRLASQYYSAEKTSYCKTYEKDGKKLTVVAQDFVDFMTTAANELRKAQDYATDGSQQEMVKSYVEHF